MRAVLIEEFGGPDVLQVAEVPEPQPGDGEVLIEVSRAGVNFADTHTREDSYVARYGLPLIPGNEVVGTTGDGRRVVAMLSGTGGYAERAVAPEHTVFEVPEGLEEGAALALLIQGLTAWHLLRTSAHLREGESVVVHSASGGTGGMALQLARIFGAGRVIASASSAEKRERALEAGADAVVDGGARDLTAALLEANGGEPVDVVLEMSGGPVFDQSLEALAPFGRLVIYGVASREQVEVRQGRLMKHSRAVVGFWLGHCLGRRDMMAGPLAELFALAAARRLEPAVGETYALSDVRRLHEDLQARRTSGKLLVDPSR
ncbi:MAG: zinc-binding dehydrogenase [Actinomycetota bacterium]|nr:zinc-binding dehydrogenase [Actinomycetota bacterium]MDQ3720322.1 zinc-binding dehydrogenase [Actinomycetota bacterium]